MEKLESNPGRWNVPFFLIFLILVVVLEYYVHIFEKGIGYYLKWQNHERQQLGRVWETDRQKMMARSQVQSLLADYSSKERTGESIESLEKLFGTLNPSQIISREKFLELYFGYPGQWSHRIIAPYELIKIDSEKTWNRVLLNRSGPWITVSFINRQNFPIHEIYLDTGTLFEVQSTRTIRRGTLEESGFRPDLVFPVREFFPLLNILDSATKDSLFPDPQWFLERNYHVTRVGFSTDPLPQNDQLALFGIEYETDFLTHVLMIPVSMEIINNLLSQIEPAENQEVETFLKMYDEF